MLGDQGWSHDVHFQHLPPFLGGRINPAENENGRVVHQNVDRSKGRDGLGRHPLAA